jgi:homoserine dehydrogenase
MNEVKVGVIGFGTVGAGVVCLLLENAALIERRLGFPLKLEKVADLDITSDRGVEIPSSLLTTDAEEILASPDISLVVELIGGLEPARTFTLRALAAGKGVVTANKALLAHHWWEICGAAQEGSGKLGFEASVGGGIPVIRALREGLAANRIESVHGIINGTCNYILTRMSREGLEFGAVLREAQEKGYAEADPTLDIEGGDAAHKLAILASLAFDTCVPLEKIYTEGISGITPVDIAIAGELGYAVKLLAVAKSSGDRVEARVHPTMIPRSHLLADVGDVFNAIYLRGDAVGPTLFYGLGAGRLPTASAVVSDLVEMARGLRTGSGPSPLVINLAEEKEVVPMDEVECPCYIRFMSPDRPGILAAISGILAAHSISIASVIQRGRKAGSSVPIVMMTHSAKEASVRKALDEIGRQEIVGEPPVCIRVEESGKEPAE